MSTDSQVAETRNGISANKKRTLSLKSLTWRVARLILLVYAGVLLFLGIQQREFIFPGKDSKGSPISALTTLPAAAELVCLRTKNGEEIAALFGSALTKDGEPLLKKSNRPTVIFFYGNAMCLAQAKQEFNHFRRLGFNIIIPEYVGYGMSTGNAGEQGCYDAADAAYEHLLTRTDVDKDKIVAAGWSLGGAVAIDLASRKPLAGLAVFSTFTSMAKMGNAVYPFIPTIALSAILRHHFSSELKMPQIHCPILIGHSRGDKIIPFSMADRLAAAATTPKRINIEKADHDAFFSGGGEVVWNGIAEFLEDIARK